MEPKLIAITKESVFEAEIRNGYLELTQRTVELSNLENIGTEYHKVTSELLFEQYFMTPEKLANRYYRSMLEKAKKLGANYVLTMEPVMRRERHKCLPSGPCDDVHMTGIINFLRIKPA